uniref:Testis-expressed sequence 9 protein n=1 Tax=Glossina brevipalpis TaxID=37001 RepID=A0A240SWE0_9MUSC
MSELLSKEKEFIELNEQLNRIASSVLDQHNSNTTNKTNKTSKSYKGQASKRSDYESTLEMPTQDQFKQIMTPGQANSFGKTVAKTENRIPVFSKGKGQSSIGKKRLGNETITEAVATGQGSHLVNKGRETSRANRVNGNTPVTSFSQAQTRKSTCKGNETSRSVMSNFKQSGGTTPAATFTVKYRNPKFVESPSLEVLVKEEYSAMRCENLNMRNTAGATQIESNTSLQGPEHRSQLSTNSSGRRHISTEGLIKFLKSKITILEEDHDRINQEMSEQKELLEKALERSKIMEQQRDQAYMKHNAVAEQLSKTESQLEEANRRLKERSVEQTAQQKELETIKRDLKIVTQTNKNLEKRLFRANEELDNARSTIGAMKTSERDLKDSTRTESEAKDKQIKSLKKQRSDLLNAYKKQLFLIDNLKRQNLCMEQSKMIAFGEKEFSKVLDWKMHD